MSDIFDNPTITRDEELEEVEPTPAQVEGKKVPRREQLVAVYGNTGQLLVQRVVDGSPVEGLREPTAEEVGILKERGVVRTLNTSPGLGAASPESRPFYKHPVFLGAALLGVVGAGYLAYRKYEDWLEEERTEPEHASLRGGFDDEEEDDSYE